MRLPVIQGLIKRRLLVNFRADPETVQRFLPKPFRPKLHHNQAMVGICLIRLEQVRPAGMPSALGVSSENAAHRMAVEWTEGTGKLREGVFIPRRDTNSLLNHLVGGRIFPGEHQSAFFSITDAGGQIEYSMKAKDGSVSVHMNGADADALPKTSCFGSLKEASAFFERGNLGYSVTREPRRLDGLELRMPDWNLRPLAVKEVQSSFFDNLQNFPKGSVQFDHALVMRDLPHEWHQLDDMAVQPAACR